MGNPRGFVKGVFMQQGGALNEYQLGLVRLIADGLTYEEMGKRLGVSPRTIKAQTDIIRRWAGVQNKREIPRRLRALGVSF